MEVIQIPKNKSISFNEYLHNIINNTTTNFASDWGFFVSTDDQINPTKPISQAKPIIQKIERVDRIPSISNLQNIDEISETIFDMDLPNTIIKENIYNQIKNNIFFFGTIIVTGSAACINAMIST